ALTEVLRSRIKMKGPLTVADYMRDCLTNPMAGYYMHRDVFGTKGDFTTSPEISGMFGEIIGVWAIYEWMQFGCPSPLNIIELGPGRGTLADDILRVFPMVFPKMKDLDKLVRYHMVEISPKLSEMQAEKLSGRKPDESEKPKVEGAPFYKQCKSKYGPEVFWYRTPDQVPRGFSFFLAHEFFDALPIHKFQLRDGEWHEVLVDVDDGPDGDHFRYVLSREVTPMQKVLLNDGDERDHIELCPDAGVIVQDMAQRIKTDGGFSLIADYGHSGEKGHSFRAFRDHKIFEPLQEPGTADLTADVDFSFLKEAAGNRVACHGPITQRDFLHNMGIELRLQILLKNASEKDQHDLISGYDTLTNPEIMGERFKFFVMMQNRKNEYTPTGIVSPTEHKPLVKSKKPPQQ
ncbi:hypothetical protein CAPTEDRAFT_117962, partial [Capitella teleta]